MAAARSPLPPIARTITPLEWAVVLGLWLVMDIASADILQKEISGRGVQVTVQQVRVAQMLDWAVWALLLPVIYRFLDRWPLRRGTWLAHLLLWMLLGLAAGLLHAGMTLPLVHLAARLLEVPPETLVVSELRLFTMVRDDLSNFTLALMSYVPLQFVHRNREERRRAKELEGSLREARLHALALQLQPHFLFNALNGIAALTRTDPRTAEQMLVRLSDLLRLTLATGTDGQLPLAEEVRRLGLYLALQQMRHGSRLAVVQSVPAELGDALVPSMLLQPLAENAISHGIGGRPGPGTLWFAVSRSGDRLLLELADDGVGVPASGPERNGIGLGNTRARLAVLYPGAHDFHIGPRPGGGTLVRISLPLATRAGLEGEPA
jgi:sensor histidine kinase YesM